MDERLNGLEQIFLADDRNQIAVMVELCRKHLRKYPKDGFAWLYYGMSQTSLARYASAEKAIRRGMRLYPPSASPNAFTQMGHLFRKKGDLRKAAFWHRKALARRPNDATYHVFLGEIAFTRGLHKQAENHYRNALKCTEGCVDEAYFNLGVILLGMRKYSEAIACYREALKIDPEYKIAKERLEDAELALLMGNSKM
jgi:tetratricopeptide (TPR) repeat protein